MIMTNAQETEVQKRASSSKLLVTPSYNFSSSILLGPPISIWTSLTAVLYYELKHCAAKKQTNNNWLGFGCRNTETLIHALKLYRWIIRGKCSCPLWIKIFRGFFSYFHEILLLEIRSVSWWLKFQRKGVRCVCLFLANPNPWICLSLCHQKTPNNAFSI